MADSIVSATGEGRIVSVEWLQRVVDEPGVVVIDARPPEQYLRGHIPAALNSDQNALRLPDSSPQSIARFVDVATNEVRRLGLNQSDRVIFYEDFSGAAAARGVWMLDFLGLTGGAMLDGGLSAWAEAGGAVSRDRAIPEPSSVVPIPDLSTLATAGEMVNGIAAGDGNLMILDTRSDLERRSGTIPSSIHIEWLRQLDETGRLRPRSELDALYRDQGFDPASGATIIPFCGSGYRAAHAYIVLKALGYPSVKNYAPSWGEWGRRPELPVERPGVG
jgi:thiosulfate/3-mercaptopyruvate sulfurtransferase